MIRKKKSKIPATTSTALNPKDSKIKSSKKFKVSESNEKAVPNYSIETVATIAAYLFRTEGEKDYENAASDALQLLDECAKRIQERRKRSTLSYEARKMGLIGRVPFNKAIQIITDQSGRPERAQERFARFWASPEANGIDFSNENFNPHDYPSHPLDLNDLQIEGFSPEAVVEYQTRFESLKKAGWFRKEIPENIKNYIDTLLRQMKENPSHNWFDDDQLDPQKPPVVS